MNKGSMLKLITNGTNELNKRQMKIQVQKLIMSEAVFRGEKNKISWQLLQILHVDCQN